MDNTQQQTEIDIDIAAKQRLSNFRFRFGSSHINSNASTELDSPSSNVRDFDISPNTTPTGTPMSKSHGRSPSHHSRSHSRSGSLSTTFTFPLKPSTMNNLPPNANMSCSNQSHSASDSSSQPVPFGFIPSGTTAPRSRPNSHHKRRSSVSTRRESAEIMGVSAPETESDTIMDGRRMALWALEGKGKMTTTATTTTTRRPDFISGYTQVEIPELSEMARDFGSGDENEPPAWSSSGFSSFNHNSFPPLAPNSTKRDAVNTTSLVTSSSGKRDTYPFFGPGINNSAGKRDSFGSGFGIGMMSVVGKRDSFGKFLNACTVSDQLGTLLEEEEDVEEEEEVEKGEEEEVEEEEECDEDDDDEEAQQADETFRAVDEIQTEGRREDDDDVDDDDDGDEILLEMSHQLNEKPLSHISSSHPRPSSSSCFSPMSSPLSALVSTPTTTTSMSTTPAPIPTFVTATTTPLHLHSPIFNSVSTTDGISAATVPLAPPPTTTTTATNIPIVDSLSPFLSSSPTLPPPFTSTTTTASTVTSSRPRPANLNLNIGLRPLSLTPDSLPLNTRAASITPLTSSNMNDTSTSTPGSGTTGSASARIPGLRPLSLVAAVSMSSPSGLSPSTSSSSQQSQSSVTRRMSLLSSFSSPSPSNNNNNIPSSSNSSSSVSYRRSSLSFECGDTSPASSAESSSRPGPLYQYATTLRRTSQSHLPTPGATPTSAVSPLHSGMPFGMSMMREEEEGDEDEDETINNSDEMNVEKDGDAQPQGSDGDASTPTNPTSTTTTSAPGKLSVQNSALDRPLSPTEQAFLYRSHTSLLCRISELEDIISKNQQQQHIASSGQQRLRSRGRSGALSPGDSSSSSYGRSGHGRFESSISSVSTNTSIDSAAVSSTSSNSSEPSDELLQLITDLKAERDSLMRDVQVFQERVAELEKTIATLTRRVEAERRESWVAQERMSVLEIERRRAAEEVSRLKDAVRDLDRAKSEEIERVKTEVRLEKERISKLEVQVEDVRRELDAERFKTKQAEDEACMLRNKVEEMSREMDELRALVSEQQAQILQFQQMQMQAQIRAKRIGPKMLNNSFASTSTTASGSLSFSNSHSHMSSSSTLAVDEIEVEDGEGEDRDHDHDDAGRFKYVPFGMSPPRSQHSHVSGATLGSVAEAEEEVCGGVPRDITADETGEDDDDDDEDSVSEDHDNELAHYEDSAEFDEDALEDDDEEDGDVVWGEDATTSSFGDFVPRRNVSSTPTPVPSPAAPLGSRRGHARVGSMEKGWSFATARVNAVVQAQTQAQDLTRDASNPETPKVDRFFECLEDLEDDESSSGAIANLELPDSKSFWSGMVKQNGSAGDDEDDEMDLPPFLLPAGMDADSSAASSSSSLVLDTIAEEEEEEEDEGLSAYLQTPSWKDLIAEKLDIVDEEEDEEIVGDEGVDEYQQSPSIRPSFYAQRNSHIQSLLPRPVSLVPPASVLSQMTPNTLKTTLDATVRSPPNDSKPNRWSIGASLGINLLNHSNSNSAVATTTNNTTTPVKPRFSLSPSTPVSISNLGNALLPTPPPTLIPRLVSKSGLSSSASPTSPVSPSPALSSSSSSVSSSRSSPVLSEFAEREREIGLSTPTPRSPLFSSRYGPLSPSRIPTPRKSVGGGGNGLASSSASAAITSSGSDCFAKYFHNGSNTRFTFDVSHEGEAAGSGSGINGQSECGRRRNQSGNGDDDDDDAGEDTLVAMGFRDSLNSSSDDDGLRDGNDGCDVGSRYYSSSRSRSKVDRWSSMLGGGHGGDTRSRSHSAGIGGSRPDQSLDLDSIAVGSGSGSTNAGATTVATGNNDNNNTILGGFARRLAMKYLGGGGSAVMTTSNFPFPPNQTQTTQFRQTRSVSGSSSGSGAFVDRVKQLELLRARIRGQNESQGRRGLGRSNNHHRGGRMKVEDVRFVGCSHCADSNVIFL